MSRAEAYERALATLRAAPDVEPCLLPTGNQDPLEVVLEAARTGAAALAVSSRRHADVVLAAIAEVERRAGDSNATV